MDILESLMSDVYDNRETYKENDYIIICNLLKEFYDKIKGNPLAILNDKGYHRRSTSTSSHEDLDPSSDFSDVGDDYGSSYLGDGYLSPY